MRAEVVASWGAARGEGIVRTPGAAAPGAQHAGGRFQPADVPEAPERVVDALQPASYGTLQ